MKRKTLRILLGIEAALCLLLPLMPGSFEGTLAFPLEQLGSWLRTLSLSGTAGNILAVVFYAGICMAPLAVLWALSRKRGVHLEDSLLVILTVTLFVALYLMVNPGLLGARFPGIGGQAAGKALVGGVIYSLVVGYGVLRMLRLSFDADPSSLRRYLGILLHVLIVLLVYLAFGANLRAFVTSVGSIRSANTGTESSLGMTYVFLAVRHMVAAVPHILGAGVAIAGLDLVDAVLTDPYSESAIGAAAGLSRACRRALAATALSSLAFNLMQFAFAGALRTVNITVEIPLLPIIAVLGVLLLSRYMEGGKKLKDEYDMIV